MLDVCMYVPVLIFRQSPVAKEVSQVVILKCLGPQVVLCLYMCMEVWSVHTIHSELNGLSVHLFNRALTFCIFGYSVRAHMYNCYISYIVEVLSVSITECSNYTMAETSLNLATEVVILIVYGCVLFCDSVYTYYYLVLHSVWHF